MQPTTSLSTNDTQRVSEHTPLLREIERNDSQIDPAGGRSAACGSNFTAYIDIVCIVAGTGILGLPYTLKQSGWIGMGLIVLAMITTSYTSILLIKCLHYNSPARLTSYADIGYHAYGNVGKYVTAIFNSIVLLGVPVLFLIFAAQNLNDLAIHNFEIELGTTKWTVICGLLVAGPFITMKTIKEITILSFFGSFSTLFCVLVVVVLSILDTPDNHPDLPPPEHKIISFSEFPVAFAAISFSFGGNSVFPHIEEAMQKPNDWGKVLISALSTCAVINLITAGVAYGVYGDNVASPVLSSVPKGLALTVATLMITLHVLFATPILMTAFAYDAEKVLRISRDHLTARAEFLFRSLFRAFLVIFSVFVAVIVPFFGNFMALLGALANCLLGFVFPVLFYLKLYGSKGVTTSEIIWCMFVMAMGTIGCLFGSADAILALVKDFRESKWF